MTCGDTNFGLGRFEKRGVCQSLALRGRERILRRVSRGIADQDVQSLGHELFDVYWGRALGEIRFGEFSVEQPGGTVIDQRSFKGSA